jgi:AcrR family transcriptional regulator
MVRRDTEAAPGAVAVAVRRPRGRRRQILLAAADQFHRRGYHQVAMAEVAAAVGITAPALYRHFRGKPELLRQAVRAGLDELAEAVDRAAAAAAELPNGLVDGPRALAEALAAVALERRELGTLWQRDARLLPAGQRAELRRTLRGAVQAAGRLLLRGRPELTPAQAESLVWSALSVSASLSYHTFAPPRRLLAQVLRAVLDEAQVGGAPDRIRRERPEDPSSAGRREELLAAAVRLFDERGFDNVSTDRLGAAVGIAGPSLYKHFPTKTDLLAAALVRCRERLWHEVAGVLAAPEDPEAALLHGIAAYADFARRHRHYLGAMVSETERLAEPDRKAALDFRRDFLRLWVVLLQRVRPEYDRTEARTRVHAMFALVNDGVRQPGRRRAGAGVPGLEPLARAVLGL